MLLLFIFIQGNPLPTLDFMIEEFCFCFSCDMVMRKHEWIYIVTTKLKKNSIYWQWNMRVFESTPA